jgi:DNA-binding beta-propeller fold protein YncE
MTASPNAQSIAGATPAPAIDEAPEGTGPLEGTTDEPPTRRRRRKVAILLLLVALLAFLFGLALWYLLFRQPIPIPSLPGEAVMPTYSTAMYGMDRPMGVAVLPDGSRLFVTETEGDRTARVLDASGAEIGLMQPGAETGAEHVPVYAALNRATNEVYVTDRPTGKIYVYDVDGVFQREFDPGAELEGMQPLGIGFDPAGNLLVTDVSTQPQSVHVFDPEGKHVRTLGTAAGLTFPNGVGADAAGNIYVTDANNGRLLVFDKDDNLVAQVGRGSGTGNLGLPRGLVVTGDRVYVADATGHSVYVYGTFKPGDRSLTFLGSFGTQGLANGAFQHPNGIAVDDRGRVYVTDAGNDRVQVWSY